MDQHSQGSLRTTLQSESEDCRHEQWALSSGMKELVAKLTELSADLSRMKVVIDSWRQRGPVRRCG